MLHCSALVKARLVGQLLLGGWSQPLKTSRPKLAQTLHTSDKRASPCSLVRTTDIAFLRAFVLQHLPAVQIIAACLQAGIT